MATSVEEISISQSNIVIRLQYIIVVTDYLVQTIKDTGGLEAILTGIVCLDK